MSSIAGRLTDTGRPAAVRLAVILTLAGLAAAIPFFFAPGFEDVPVGAYVFSAVSAIVLLVAARPLWNCHRWAAIAVFVVTLLNVLTSLPGLIDPPSGWVRAAVIIGLVFSIPVLVLLALPESRRSYR